MEGFELSIIFAPLRDSKQGFLSRPKMILKKLNRSNGYIYLRKVIFARIIFQIGRIKGTSGKVLSNIGKANNSKKFLTILSRKLHFSTYHGGAMQRKIWKFTIRWLQGGFDFPFGA
jgi:hypothetical protein